ncbi:Fe-S protein assembly co-chaperone HscB [Pedobacter cryoconitis]|uniref:Fe-S protein assembly co-chaperone HscB n=1 Tax=Pedobacter cryoconitis TaxID=188932 RepID=UPI00160E416D|nr:Fe-S protein assembly co-chaperone HscB [Pedobacter cryoconitis]MBB5646676.1 molecular chaperone HscB [Pedobacter cryoconitis]
MDYFEFYKLPVSFNPDAQLVKQQFYALSKKYHPDFYINESAEKQEEVLELSTLNNKAYQVLSDPQKRLHYILELKGILAEGENYSLPQGFLMEMMDVNEALMELQFEPDTVKLEEIKKEIDSIADSMQQELDRLIVVFDTQNKDTEAITLAAIKDLYYRKKYLNRINDSLLKLG